MSKSNIIRVSISNDSIKALGFYYDAKGNHNGFNRSFKDESTMQNEFNAMRDRDCDMQIVINRQQSKIVWN